MRAGGDLILAPNYITTCSVQLDAASVRNSLVYIYFGAEHQAASGTLLKRASAHLVELGALFWMAVNSFGGFYPVEFWGNPN